MQPLPTTEQPLTHDLEPHFERIKSFATHADLEKSDLFRQQGPEIERVIHGLAWRNSHTVSDNPSHIRVAAWNIERGLKIDGVLHVLKTHPVLSKADVLLITEADIGMGRTDNRDIPRELADALGMNYVFANCFLCLEKGDIGEQNHDRANTLSLHGICFLSRFPITACRSVPLPMFRDVFNDLEKRLGGRKGLICTLTIGDRPIVFCVTHIELATSAAQRGQQMQALLQAVRQNPSDAMLIGGDFNTITYDLRSKKHLFASLSYKTILGVHRVIRHYMTPDKHFEKPLFDVLSHHEFDFNTPNDRSMGTLYYDINDPIIEAKLRQYRIPKFLLTYLRHKLARYNGRVPLRLDWFAARGLKTVTQPSGDYGPPKVIDRPLWQGQPVSDHSPIVVDLQV